jgi:hypothetical protein
MGKEVAGARMKKRAMGASRKGKKMAAAEMMMPPMAMKKGGKVDFSKVVQDKKTGKLSEKPAMKPGGMGSKKGGIALMIVLGKGDGKKKSK